MRNPDRSKRLSAGSAATATVARYRTEYRDLLIRNVAPFWMRHGVDRRHGGLGNILDDSGRTIGHDKYLWSQGRALWTFSALWNRVAHRPAWLAAARHVFRYLTDHGRDARGRWMFRLDAAGKVCERDTSIYVDGFVLHGLGEYYRATGDRTARRMALATADSICERLANPGSFKVAPYVIPRGLKTHGINMIFGSFLFAAGRIFKRCDLVARGLELGHEILDAFYDPVRNAVVEFITLENRFQDSGPGRTCVPGHVLESMWFLIEMFEQTGETDRIQTCCRLIRRHLELGWDARFGGIKLALDIDGRKSCHWEKADCKPWWVHCEALVATLFAYIHTRQPWCLAWHRRIRAYAFKHYPVPTGEWTQWLDRKGRPMASAALPVKDPFHLPRALIYLDALCRVIEQHMGVMHGQPTRRDT